MTDDQQRIAIARCCGWEWHNGSSGGCYVSPDKSETVRCWSDLPDYLNDPDATFVSALYGSGYMQGYWENLHGVVGQNSTRRDCEKAPTRKKAEAFLRTIGKWKS